jgi:hypothetical protein
MNQSNPYRIRLVLNAAASVAAAFTLGLFLLPAPCARASGAADLIPLDDHLQPVPMTSSVDKGDGENGPYVLSLKNTSGDSLRATATVQLSVASNGDKKTRDIGENVVGRAEVWTIPGLAAGDKVTIFVQGYSPLEISIP